MRTVALSFMLALFSLAACGSGSSNTGSKSTSSNGEVIVMNKDMFIEKVFDYENDKELAYKGDLPAIIDFYADWCGPCRTIAPILKKLAKEYEGQIVVYKVDVDKERELAQLFEISSIPLVVFIPVDGEPTSVLGASPESEYRKMVEEYLLKEEE